MATPMGTDKAAMLLNSLPPEVIDKVLERLGPERSARLRLRMQALPTGSATPEALDELARELESLLGQPRNTPSADTAAKLAVYRRAAESDTPAATPGESEKETNPADPTAALADLPIDVLTNVLHGEQAHTVAMVLNSLPVDRAGDVLQRLPPAMRREVPVCLSRQTVAHPALLQRVAQALLHKARSAGKAGGPAEAGARYEKIANMIRTLEKADRNEVLAALTEQEPEAATKVKELLYHFEDLLKILDRSMQKLLSEIDSRSLATALKGATDEIVEKVMKNLSMRARETLQEEMELLGMPPVAQVRQAQKMVVDVIQRLDQAGELQMEE